MLAYQEHARTGIWPNAGGRFDQPAVLLDLIEEITAQKQEQTDGNDTD
jgi:hypothetical protein